MRNDSWCFNLRYFAEIENLLICKLKLKNLSRHRYWLAQTWIGRWKRSTNYKTRFMVRKVQKLSLEMTHGIYTVAHLRCHQVKVSCLFMFCVGFWNLSSFCWVVHSAHWPAPSLRCWIIPSYTTSTEMTVHRKTFDELSSNEFFWGGTIPSNWIG